MRHFSVFELENVPNMKTRLATMFLAFNCNKNVITKKKKKQTNVLKAELLLQYFLRMMVMIIYLIRIEQVQNNAY